MDFQLRRAENVLQQGRSIQGGVEVFKRKEDISENQMQTASCTPIRRNSFSKNDTGFLVI